MPVVFMKYNMIFILVSVDVIWMDAGGSREFWEGLGDGPMSGRKEKSRHR